MQPNLIAFAAARDALLQRVIAGLVADERVLAAWLSGSLGRGEGDAASDIDLDVVVSDAAAGELCRRPWLVAGETTPERLAFFARFGRPVIVHENHHNALAGGTFTAVFYAEGAQSIDWRLVPLSRARRPAASRLLFERTAVPLGDDVAAADGDRLTEVIAFAWMMVAVLARKLARAHATVIAEDLARLVATVAYVEEALDMLPKGKEVAATGEISLPAARATLNELRRRLEALALTAQARGARVPEGAGAIVAARLALSEGGKTPWNN